MHGPGRVLMLSRESGRAVVVYPDSDKIGARPGPWGTHAEDRGNFRRSRRGRLLGRRAVRTVANLFDVETTQDADDPAGYETPYARVGPLVGGVGARGERLPAGRGPERLPVPLGGRRGVAARARGPRRSCARPEGEEELEPGDSSASRGARGRAQGDEPSRRARPYRDPLDEERARGSRSTPTRTRSASGRPGKLFRLDDAVDYWEGEL